MVKRRGITCAAHVLYKHKPKDTKNLAEFRKRVQEFVNAESKKIPGLKPRRKETMPNSYAGTKGELLSIVCMRDFLDIIFLGNDNKKGLSMMDKLVNKILSFLEASEFSVKSVMVTFDKSIPIMKNPLPNFFNTSALADLNTNLKNTFNPAGAVFISRIKNNQIVIFISKDEDETLLDISVGNTYREKLPWDLLKESNESINKLKPLY